MVENHTEKNAGNVTRTVWNTIMATARTCLQTSYRILLRVDSSLTQEALRSWSYINLEIFNECLLSDHYLLIFHECHSCSLVYDVSSVDISSISQVFKYN